MKNRNFKRVANSFFQQPELGTILPLLCLMAVVAIVNPAFFSGSNIIDLLRTATFSFVVAVPITFLMASGGMDLSIGALTSFGGVICGMAMRAGMPIGFSILLALLGGMLVGFINGVIIVRFEMPAFITTLGTQYAVNGLIAIITQNVPISGFSPTFKNIGQYRIGGIFPIVVIYALIIGVVGHSSRLAGTGKRPISPA